MHYYNLKIRMYFSSTKHKHWKWLGPVGRYSTLICDSFKILKFLLCNHCFFFQYLSRHRATGPLCKYLESPVVWGLSVSSSPSCYWPLRMRTLNTTTATRTATAWRRRTVTATATTTSTATSTTTTTTRRAVTTMPCLTPWWWHCWRRHLLHHQLL